MIWEVCEYCVKHWMGLGTIVSAIGAAVFAFFVFLRFRKEGGEIGNRVANLFLVDTFIFTATALFGVSTFLEIDLDYYLYPMRIFFLIMSIYHGWKLMKPFK